MQIKSIMIVDDSESDQYITERVIKEFDSSIIISKAYDGDEALEMLKDMDEQPSLILLDINMPRMNGLEFLEHYKSQNPSSIVVMLSSSDQERDKTKAFSYDVVKQYIIKPLEVKDLENIAKL